MIDSLLLTIIVPTYNRARSLKILLHALRQELASIQDQVAVIIGDNASNDETSSVTRVFQDAVPSAIVIRHEQNLGADENFCRCVERVQSRYFWIIGDDDLPKRGVVAKLLTLLRTNSPSLVYVQSEWLNPVTGADQGKQVGLLHVESMDALTFARRVHVWLTFISGVIVDRTALQLEIQPENIRRFVGTSLVQLGWTLPLLRSGVRFDFVSDRCILATKDNSGGYSLLTVFGANFTSIVNATFGTHSPFSRVLISGNIRHYLPGLLWGTRSAPSGRHTKEDAWPAMRKELGHRPLFWLLLFPLGRFPRVLAQPIYQAWRVFHRFNREVQRLRQQDVDR